LRSPAWGSTHSAEPRCQGQTAEVGLGSNGTLVSQTAVLNQPGFVKTPVPYRVGFVDFGPIQVMGL
jgi:uncharacterized OB-fold protein